MNYLYRAALEVQNFCHSQGWSCCLIGGLAVNRWGQPRVTQDVDFSLLTGFGEEEKFVDKLLSQFRGRRPDAKEFGLIARVLLLQTSDDTFADVALAGLPFEEEMLARSTPFDFAPTARLITASAEDIVVLKAFAARSKDWGDVEGIIIRQGDALDWSYIAKNLAAVCSLMDAPERVEELERLRRRLQRK